MKALYGIPILYNIGAIAGALFFGHLSQKIGRRNSIMLALVMALLSIPAWAFGTTLGVLVAGSFMMQVGVQGAFGVIPAHLNELSPDAVRSLFPGLVYQLGVLLASPATVVEFMLRDRFGYPWALTMFEAGMIVLMIVIFWFGPEARDRSFLRRVRRRSTAISERGLRVAQRQEKPVNEKRIGIIMNGVTGRMGLNQHLVRSILAIRKQGGVELADGSRLVPDPILVGRNAAKLEQIAKEHGVARWTTDLRGALANPNDSIYFDAQLTTLRAPSVESGDCSRQACLLREAARRRFRDGVAAGRPGQGCGSEARRRAGQALSARNAQAQAAGGQWFLWKNPFGARRVRLLGL